MPFATVAATSAKATIVHTLWKRSGTNQSNCTAQRVVGSNWSPRGCVPGLSTWSKMGPISSSRKASNSPTSAIDTTEASNCNQYGLT